MKKTKWQPPLPPARNYKAENLTELLKVSKFLYQIGEAEFLRKPSKRIAVSDIPKPVMQQKIAYLKKCMLCYRRLTGGKGRGIAAPQVGIPERFSVVYMPEVKGSLLVIINPRITKNAKTLFRYPEACMSANSLIAPVVRPAWVEFAYYDETGKKQLWTMKDTEKNGRMYNRVVQHEIDHLDGIINIDRVKSRELVFESSTEYYENAKFEEVSR